MFLRYMNRKRVINLDNFDEIHVEEKRVGCYTEHAVVAVKYEPTFELKNIHFELYRLGTSETVMCIKSFRKNDDANAFYEKLQKAWINKEKIFEVD